MSDLTSYEMSSGDEPKLVITVKDQAGNAINLTGAQEIVYALAKSSKSPIEMEKKLSTGTLSVADAVNGRIEILLLNADTESLVGKYYEELRLVDTLGKRYTSRGGRVTIHRNLIT